MPASTAVVCDSVACVPADMLQKHNIRVLPINFYHGGKLYRDGVDVTTSQAYELLRKDPESFKTSSISPGECQDTFREAAREAANIVCITLSSKLSVVYNVARSAAEQVQRELPDLKIEVVDSQTVAAAEAFVVLAAARAAEAGQSLEDIIRAAEQIRDKVRLVAIMETVRYVYRTGRIPKIAARVGSMLNIRPMFTVTDGVPHFIGAARNKERGIDRLIQLIKENVGDGPVHMAVMHAYAASEAEKLRERVSAEFNCTELWISEFSPIMGYSVGVGTLGCAYYID